MTRSEKAIIQSVINYHNRRAIILSKSGNHTQAQKEEQRCELMRAMLKQVSGSCVNCRHKDNEVKCMTCVRFKGRTDNFSIDKRFQLCHRMRVKSEGYKIGG